MDERRLLRRQPEDHHFWSLVMLAVTAAAFLLVRLGSHESAICVSPRVSHPLKGDWQRHVLASSGYLERCGTRQTGRKAKATHSRDHGLDAFERSRDSTTSRPLQTCRSCKKRRQFKEKGLRQLTVA
jgi:hypothetical protein